MSRLSRRDFVKATAVGLGASPALRAVPGVAWAQGSDLIRVGLIGCGGRGTGAAKDIVTGAENVEIVAMGDLFPDRLGSRTAESRPSTSRRALGSVPDLLDEGVAHASAGVAAGVLERLAGLRLPD